MLRSSTTKQIPERLWEECLVIPSSFKMPWVRRYRSSQFRHDFTNAMKQMETNIVVVHIQVGKTIQLVTTFIGGFTIAFVRGWLLALVMVSAIPLLVLAGATIARYMSQMASRGQSAYASAANVVEQTIGSIRTV